MPHSALPSPNSLLSPIQPQYASALLTLLYLALSCPALPCLPWPVLPQRCTVRGVASHFFPLSPFKKMVSLDNSVKMSYS